ncbi:MAG: hypothetical protein DI539_15575 [Flavobacterium psychrophilum]|nr:MAG: hypothetical protein DI539_15575 [Flavobacterium psychrophilum]
MKKAFLILIMFTMFSCQKTVVFNEVKNDFPNNQWGAANILEFEFKLEKDVAAGDIKLLFSHIHEPQYTTVPLAVTIEDPSGAKENLYINIRLKDAAGNNLSECAGDMCDLYTNIKEGVKLAKGDYRITVQNKFTHAYLPNALAVGLSVEEIKSK